MCGEVGHERESPLRFGPAQYGPAPRVQNLGARVGEEFGDVGRQRLGHPGLPQESGLHVAGPLHRAGGVQQLLPTARGAQPVLGEEVLAVEEIGAVGEERHRVGAATECGAVTQGGRKGVPEAGGKQRLHRQRERGVAELRGPRRVAQIHVGLGGSAGELGGDGAAVAVRGGQGVDLRDADERVPPLEGADDQIRDDGAPPGGDLGDPPGEPGRFSGDGRGLREQVVEVLSSAPGQQTRRGDARSARQQCSAVQGHGALPPSCAV